MLTRRTERNACSGVDKIPGCSRRSQIRNAARQACVPVLKTNSTHGVLVFGSNENGVCCEAEYPMTANLKPSY